MKCVAAAGAAMILAFGFIQSADAAPDTPPQPVTMPALPADAKPQPVAFSRLVSTIDQGVVWATFDLGITCTLPPTGRNLSWDTKNNTFNSRVYGQVFAKELKAAGFIAADDPDDLFQKNRNYADLKIAGNIKSIHAKLCIFGFFIEDPANPQKIDPDTVTGSILLDIDWQLYSQSHDKIILNREIQASYSLAHHAQGNFGRLIEGGIRENIRTLIASDEFRQAVIATPTKPDLSVQSKTQLRLDGSSNAKPTKISDAVGSVVLVMSGGGHGSGFLVSTDGYLLTAQHVVGADKYVKIRWSDGLEGVGEVIRTDKRRDVALIKTDSRGRAPLALHRDMPQPGDTVFAIGTPIDPKLQNTVTRGVASANRILDGFSFIQSDVTVDPGNSGGPLLNEQGEVLGLTDIGIRLPDAPTGLNFFIPIRDALDFLSLEPR